ncbi:DUF4192 domain-containing protein [Nocardioides sp. Soil805]|uniref:DUF4192 domain-containing protein n=1 Tax=Nocardioides sp. Soil805 TaxID=1736416 RepID=UPI000702686A|nr:DUF4192 domain-containing protein [Nocardioides sp. Soil805]KRF34338.1 hypothetical protein ASG94_16665 [Nocardioides sp. Soil805]
MTPTPTPIPLVARTPEDIVAFVPIALGFAPETSVAMLTFGEQPSFHARVDLPDDAGDVDDVVDALLRPSLRHRVRQVIFVVYDDDTLVADECAWSLHEAFTERGIEVIDVLRVHDCRWFAVLPGRTPEAYRGVPFDPGAHPFTARAVFDGRVTHGSRAELRATLDPVEDAVTESAAFLATDPQPLPAREVRAVVHRHTREPGPCPVEVLVPLALALREPASRDEAWCGLTRPVARAHVELWSDVVRRVPDEIVAGPAAVLAVAAWLAGDGALAWCAVERCRAVAPDHSLARLVADLLDDACSPDLWEPLRASFDRGAA